MLKRFLIVGCLGVLVAFAALAGRSSAAPNASGVACGPAPHKLAKRPALLPSKFPTPSKVAYTSARRAGPTKIVGGYWPMGNLTAIHKAYSKALKAAKYTITHEEQDEADSEVNFKGFSTSGQVKLSKRCSSRILITVTIRPA